MKYQITGQKRLTGELSVYNAKNSLLVLLAASILTKEQMVYVGCRRITDVEVMIDILRQMGATVYWQEDNLVVNSENLSTAEIPEHLSGKMRGSIFLLGALLGRCKKATAFTPGGCAIGKRPIDIHIDSLTKLGVSIVEEGNRIDCVVAKPSCGEVALRFPSVGATENLIMYSVLSTGITTIDNAAREPEVEALCDCLNRMGANIVGGGTSTIIITGVDVLHGIEFKPIPDRIVAATYLIAGAITGGDILIRDCNPRHFAALTKLLRISGCKINLFEDAVRLKSDGKLHSLGTIITDTYPAFATDMQSLILTQAAISVGKTQIVEKVFENRLLNNASQLSRMGAKIDVTDNTAIITGVKNIYASDVTCYDLRGGAGLVLAGLAAVGTTTVSEVHHIERGYSALVASLVSVGADIVKIE